MRIQISARESAGQRNDGADVAKAARGGKRRKRQDFNTKFAEKPQSALRSEPEKRLPAQVEELAHVAELLVAGVEEFLDALIRKDEELTLKGVAE